MPDAVVDGNFPIGAAGLTMLAATVAWLAHEMTHLHACHDCDAVQKVADLRRGARARCFRCGAVLVRQPPGGPTNALAWSLAAACFFILSHVFPVVAFEMPGGVRELTIIAGMAELGDGQMVIVTVALVFSTLIVPLLQLTALLSVLWPIESGRAPHSVGTAIRALFHLAPWGMVEIFLLAVLVSAVKLQSDGDIYPRVGIVLVVAFVFTMSAALAAFEPRQIWSRLEPSS